MTFWGELSLVGILTVKVGSSGAEAVDDSTASVATEELASLRTD
jgi:hypothetical protein